MIYSLSFITHIGKIACDDRTSSGKTMGHCIAFCTLDRDPSLARREPVVVEVMVVIQWQKWHSR